MSEEPPPGGEGTGEFFCDRVALDFAEGFDPALAPLFLIVFGLVGAAARADFSGLLTFGAIMRAPNTVIP